MPLKRKFDIEFHQVFFPNLYVLQAGPRFLFAVKKCYSRFPYVHGLKFNHHL